MKKFYTPFYLISIALLFVFCMSGNTQITVLANAVQTDLTLRASADGTDNRSGIAYNPVKQVYYSVDAGNASFPVDSYNASGELIDSVAAGFDYRGAWWNPNLFTFEGNGFSSAGIFSKSLDPFTGAAVAGGTIVATNTQPYSQSVGDMDTANYELIYYYSGSIYRYSRLDDAVLGSAAVSGLPGGATLNSNTICYTGLKDMEYGVYDYTNLRFIFLNRLGEYVDHSQLPAEAYPASSFKISWAKQLFWVYNPDDDIWYSYKVFEGFPLSVKGQELNGSKEFTIFPNPVDIETHLDFGSLDSEVSYIRLLSLNGEVVREITNIPATNMTLNLQNEAKGIYILQLTTLDGANYYRKLVKK